VAFWAVSLGVLTVLSRIPLRSHYLFAWDSANFALALDQYNVAFHQPQPPGYPLYVATAWLVRLALHDANASYVALSIVASGLAVVFLVLAAGRLYGRTTALLAGVLLATSSVFWSQGEVAYPYAFLACFSALVGWLCVEVQSSRFKDQSGSRGDVLVVAIGVVLGIAAGFRTELLGFLLPGPGGVVVPLPVGFLVPLWLYVALLRPGAWRRKVAALVVGGVACAAVVVAWYLPMVARSGGWAAYQQATGSYYTYFIETTSGAGKLLVGLLENMRDVVGFLYNGVGLALVPMVYFLGRYFAPGRLVTDGRARLVTLWLAPPVLFYVTVHIGNPGYVLSFLPAACIYAAEALLGLLEDVRQAAVELIRRLGENAFLRALSERGWLVPTAIVAALAIGLSNAVLFRLGTGEGRYPEIRQIDRIFARQLAYIQQRYPPGSTLLVAYDRSRQYHYYLPPYRINLLFDVAVAGAVTDTSRYWERRTELTVPAGTTTILFPDLVQNSSDNPGLVQHVDLGEGVDLFVAAVQPGDKVRYGYQYASAQRS
jgi:hypothetical protein